jgi:HlyD family secretion protein
MKSFKGEIKAGIVETRFALSGKIVFVGKHTGDSVKKGNLIASLDRKILQTELDRELADYEKVRADFDGFAKKYPDPQDDNKYTKAEKQASLNVSVKSVELAKARLDQVDLFSPVDGTIMDDSGIMPGLYVTPAGSSVKIIDTSSYYFEIEIEQKDILYFSEPKKAEVHIEPKVVSESASRTTKIEETSSRVLSNGKSFYVKIPITNPSILLGMRGEAKFS